MVTHSLAACLKALLRAANPNLWGELSTVTPAFTRRYIAGVLVKEVEQPPVVEKPIQKQKTPEVSYAEDLVALQNCIRALPRVFTEDEIPPKLRAKLPRLELLGILQCTSRKRAEIKQYLRVGV